MISDVLSIPPLEDQFDTLFSQLTTLSPQILRHKPRLVQLFRNAGHPISQDDDLKLLLDVVKMISRLNQESNSTHEQLFHQNLLLANITEKLVKEV